MAFDNIKQKTKQKLPLPVINVLAIGYRFFMKRKKTIKKLWYYYSPKHYSRASIMADKAYYHLLEGNLTVAKKSFANALKWTKYRNKDSIDNTFDLLYYVFSESSSIASDIYDQSIIDKKIQNTPLILIDGMYASGSSATFDYLANYEQIHTNLNNYNEYYFVRSCHGIHDICMSTDSQEEFEKKLVLFFGKLIIGLSKPNAFSTLCGYEDNYHLNVMNNKKIGPLSHEGRVIALEEAVKGMNSNHQLGVLGSLSYFIASYLAFCKDVNDKSQKVSLSIFLKENIEYLIKMLIYFKSGLAKHESVDYLITKNLFKLSDDNADSIKYLNDYYYLPTVRDPRSQYIQIAQHGKRFDLQDYIKIYKKIRERLDANIKKAVLKEGLVHIVQFEELVLSEEYGKTLCEFLGLDHQRVKSNKRFSRDESRTNVFNYKDYADQRSISIIENELSEYLYIPM